jgi:signal transduction histidine kinase/ActR/RegA family two-component response regulator
MKKTVAARRFSWRVYRDAQPPRGLATAAVLVGIFAVLALSIRVFCRDAHGWSPFWPANGAIVAALLVLPKRLGLSVMIIDGVINMMANTFYNYTFQILVFDAILNCGAGLILAILVRNFCGAATDLSRFRRLVTFMGLAVVAAGIEAAIGEGLNAIARTPDVDIGGWFWWTLCDGLGLIIATPAVLLCVKNKRYLKLQDASLGQRIGLFALILAVATASFLQSHSALWVFVYPLLLLMAFSAGPPWVLASVLTVSVVASGLTVHGYGPLVSLAPTDARMKQNVVQQFLLSLFVCAVPANNALGEMGRVAQRLRRIHAMAREAQSAAVTANLAKSQFIANVSHEIRTPLNGVLGMAQVLAAGDLSALQRERVEIIHSSGEVLLSILNDVLDFSKIEAGKLDLEATPFDLVKVVHDVQAAFSAVAETKGLRFGLRLEGRPDPAGADGDLYVGDPTRVRQIISNLVSNALKFTPAGEVEIGVSGRDRDVVVWVRDTGVGIPEDRLPKLFGQFEQVDASTTRRFGGTGLGLSICHELCRLMGGRIVVESGLGQGSTFTVHLPLSRVGAPEAALAPELSQDGAQAEVATQDLRVLAAEDHKINQLVLTALLRQMGVTPTLVENGALAVEAWRESEFDLILMDMQMPVMDGLAAVRAIRAAEALSSRRRRPIIALTADVMSHHLEDYRRAGVDAVVAKPLQFAELALTMQALLEPTADLDSPALMRA